MSAYPDLTRKLLLSILLLSAVCVSCLGVGVLLNFVQAFGWGGLFCLSEGMEHSTHTQLLFILSRGKFSISSVLF